MGMVLGMIYVPFILFFASVAIFGGSAQRRICLLAVIAGGVAGFGMHFLSPFVYPGTTQLERTLLLVGFFPFLVFGTWLGLTVINRLRR